ncbi:MAG: GGDEF domain-containing protein [Desulfovibrio sp.]|nr:GGDEF domain-containing protein [Desulfovibrio sp.]
MYKCIVLSARKEECDFFRSKLAPVFSFSWISRADEALDVLTSTSVYAVLVEYSLAEAVSHAFSRKASEGDNCASIPYLLYSLGSIPSPDTSVLDRWAQDILLPPLDSRLLACRIHNAARAKKSLTFAEVETVLRELPSNIFLKDSLGRYVFCTHYWKHIEVPDDPNWTIRGKRDIDIRKNRANAVKAMESDAQILKTGKGVQYIIQEEVDGRVEYLELVKRATHDSDGNINGVVALITDVTERELLRRELERRSTLDPLTGLLNKSATEDLIDLVLQKNIAAGTMEKGALLMIDVDDFKTVNDTFGHKKGDKVLKYVGGILHSAVKGSDVKGRVGGDEFMVFLQDLNDAGEAERLARIIGAQAADAFADTPLHGYLSLSIGIAMFPENGRSFGELYSAADTALYHVKENGKASYAVAVR